MKHNKFAYRWWKASLDQGLLSFRDWHAKMKLSTDNEDDLYFQQLYADFVSRIHGPEA